jgi:hypothetical protein
MFGVLIVQIGSLILNVNRQEGLIRMAEDQEEKRRIISKAVISDVIIN